MNPKSSILLFFFWETWAGVRVVGELLGLRVINCSSKKTYIIIYISRVVLGGV